LFQMGSGIPATATPDIAISRGFRQEPAVSSHCAALVTKPDLCATQHKVPSQIEERQYHT